MKKKFQIDCIFGFDDNAKEFHEIFVLCFKKFGPHKVVQAYKLVTL